MGNSLGMVSPVADIPVTCVGYSIASPTTLRPRKYRRFCAAAGVNRTDRGWGFLRCLDKDGQRITLMTEDVEYMEMLIAGRKGGALEELDVSVAMFPIIRKGWPDDW